MEVVYFEGNYINITAGRDLVLFTEATQARDTVSGKELSLSVDLGDSDVTSIKILNPCKGMTCQTNEIALTIEQVRNPSFTRPASLSGQGRQSLEVSTFSSVHFLTNNF